MKVLVTRPEEDAADTVRRLEAAGHTAVVSPVLSIQMTVDEPLSGLGVQGWLATSRNGVRALVHCEAPRDIPLLAVGRSTAELARREGFDTVYDADGDVADLADLAGRLLDPGAGRLVHAAGREVAGDLAGDLRQRGFEVDRRVLYAAEPVPVLPDIVREMLPDRQIDAALFFSARSAGVFASLVKDDRELSLALAQMGAICISRRAATALGGTAFARVVVAERPNQDALLAALEGTSGTNR